MKAFLKIQLRLKTKNPGIGQRCQSTPILKILQNNSEKFQKIMKNLKYYKTVFETKIGQIGLPERSNSAVCQYRVPDPGQG